MACRKGHLNVAKYLFGEQECSIECQDKNGNTPLHVACREGHVDIVRYFVGKHRCSTQCQNKNGNTPLHLASCKGHIGIVKYLVSELRCSTVHYENKNGNTPLHEACRKGHVDIVRYLISERKCSITRQNKTGDTPLFVACRENHLGVVKYFFSKQHRSITCQNKEGNTPLHVACSKGYVDIVRFLVSKWRCSTSCQNELGNSPLHLACREGHMDTVRYLVSEQGCSTLCRNKWGDTPLHLACSYKHLHVVEFLLTKKNCSEACKSKNNSDETPLHYCCHYGWLDLARRLVEQYCCDPESKNRRCDTPLHMACQNGHVDIVRYLVCERGCNTASQNMGGNTPLHIACSYKHRALIEILLTGQNCSVACESKDKDGKTPLHYCCHHGWLDVTRKLVEQYHCDPKCENLWGDTPLHKACCIGNLDIVRYLVSEQGCSTACKNKDGITPLREAYSKGHVDIVKYLVSEEGCGAACQNKDGDTILHEACREGLLDMVKALASGQDCEVAFNCHNKDGDTPLHVACREGHVDTVAYLVTEQGYSTACQNKDTDTPLHVACRWNRTDTVQFLLSTGRVDPWCKNATNQVPVQLTNNYEISKLFAGLTKGNLETAIKIFIFGNPAAGKSTLVKIIENKVTSRFGAIAGQFRNVSGVKLKTAGMNAVTLQSSRLGVVTIYDLAGQFEYYSSHDALVGNLISSSTAMFIVVVKLSEKEAEVIQTLQYWISFIENCCSRVEAIAHLVIIGSWADKVKEAGKSTDQKWSNIKKACISLNSPLTFVGFTALDCRKLASSGLDKICNMIESSCATLREAVKQKVIVYPHLLHDFINTKLSTKVVCSVKELCAHITAEDNALLPTEPNLLSPLLSSLNDGGHLLYLPNKKDFQAGWIVINKQAVLSDISGTVFAPENFKQHYDIATSTGVVPKSKIAGVFAEKYDVDMILCVLTIFEFCEEIKDSFTLSLIASSDPFVEGTAAMAISDESTESYYFFPALVRIEHPTDVWQSSAPRQYRCGWCLQCSKEGQHLTSRFLHVMLLRLAFSFALAPDSSRCDEASPVLQRRCAIWKNGIQWLGQNGVETIIEVSEHNKLVLILMSCLEGEEMACVQLRSSLVSKVLVIKEETCPHISTTELLIDPSNLSCYPLPSSSELTLYKMADQVVKAIRECKPCAVDITGRKKMMLDDCLHFEPFHCMHVKQISTLFDPDLADQEVDDIFLHDLATDIYPKLMQQAPIKVVLQMFNIINDCLFYNYCDQFPDEKDNPAMKCFRLLLTWKNCDTGGSTYQSLRTILGKYSIFCGRNPLVRTCILFHYLSFGLYKHIPKYSALCCRCFGNSCKKCTQYISC